MPFTNLDEETLFHAARRIPVGESRERFIAQACAGHADVEARVRALLEMHEQDPDPWDQQPTRTAEYPPIAERPGSRIGSYRILEQIGEGGFGLVFVAEQQEPVRRKVALKIIKPGMDTRQIIARFEQERQALALMDHPNIAKVLDAGETDTGRPYFVMELVRGIPITDYCDQNHLSPRERLELFVTVCFAVQHAHHKGVIHRDIKPSNVLVTSHDGKPAAKIIDFGVAKAVSQQLTERTIYTQFAQMIGTPLYMSPEQAEMSGLDIDTRTDIYSLGVLLYELLTGTTPLEKERFAQAAHDEIRRIIRDEEPARPSTRLSSLGESADVTAGNRRTNLKQLVRLLAGDVDWIVMKALEKDRNRRYATPVDFAQDVERYLADESVQARPPSAAYKARKFVLRNRTAAITASMVAVALLLGAAVATWQAIVATHAKQELLHALHDKEQARQAEEIMRRDAEQNARMAQNAEIKARAVSNFLQRDLLAQADSNAQADRFVHANPNLTVREALDRAAAELGRAFRGQEATEAELRRTIGAAYLGIGDARRAVPQLERSRDIFVQLHGRSDSESLTAMHMLGKAYCLAGRDKDATRILSELLPLSELHLGKGHPLTIACLSTLAVAGRKSDSRLAMSRFEEALRRAREFLGPDHEVTLSAMSALGVCYDQSRRESEAQLLFEEVLQIRRVRNGPSHPNTLLALNNLAACLWRQRKLDRSIPLFEEAFRLRKEIMGDDHPLTIRTQANLGINYRDAGRSREAIPILDDALRRGRPFGDAEGINLPRIIEALAEAHTRMGDHAKAEPLFREILESQRKAGQDDSKSVASWNARLGLNLIQQKRYSDAEPLIRSALTVREKHEPDNWATFNTNSLLGGVLLGQRKFAEAEPFLLHGYEGMKLRRTSIPDDGWVRLTEAAQRLIDLYEAWSKPAEAVKWREELTAINQQLRKNKD